MKRFQFKTYDEAVIAQVRQAVDSCLSQNGLEMSRHIIETVLSELIQNAVKANLKRVFFTSRHNNFKSDSHASEQFGEALAADAGALLSLLKNAPLSVRVEIFAKQKVEIHVFNSTQMNASETKRVRQALQGKRVKGEGAGIGLGMCARLLDGIGIKKGLSFQSNKNGTLFRLKIARGITAKDPRKSRVERFVQSCLPLPVAKTTADQIRGGAAPEALPDAAMQFNLLHCGEKAPRTSRIKTTSNPASLEILGAMQAGEWEGIERYFLTTLSPGRLQELRTISGRGKASRRAGIEATVAISPAVLRSILLQTDGAGTSRRK